MDRKDDGRLLIQGPGWPDLELRYGKPQEPEEGFLEGLAREFVSQLPVLALAVLLALCQLGFELLTE